MMACSTRIIHVSVTIALNLADLMLYFTLPPLAKNKRLNTTYKLSLVIKIRKKNFGQYMYVTWYYRIIIEAENSDELTIEDTGSPVCFKTYLLRLCKFAQLFCCFCTVSHSVSLLLG